MFFFFILLFCSSFSFLFNLLFLKIIFNICFFQVNIPRSSGSGVLFDLLFALHKALPSSLSILFSKGEGGGGWGGELRERVCARFVFLFLKKSIIIIIIIPFLPFISLFPPSLPSLPLLSSLPSPLLFPFSRYLFVPQTSLNIMVPFHPRLDEVYDSFSSCQNSTLLMGRGEERGEGEEGREEGRGKGETYVLEYGGGREMESNSEFELLFRPSGVFTKCPSFSSFSSSSSSSSSSSFPPPEQRYISNFSSIPDYHLHSPNTLFILFTNFAPPTPSQEETKEDNENEEEETTRPPPRKRPDTNPIPFCALLSLLLHHSWDNVYIFFPPSTLSYPPPSPPPPSTTSPNSQISTPLPPSSSALPFNLSPPPSSPPSTFFNPLPPPPFSKLPPILPPLFLSLSLSPPLLLLLTFLTSLPILKEGMGWQKMFS